MADLAVAEAIGASRSQVATRRRLLEIAAYADSEGVGSPFEWTPELITHLGSQSDSSLARQLGIFPIDVSTKRRALGIEKFDSKTWVTEALLLKLGTVPDYALILEFKKSARTFQLLRRRLGIPSYTGKPAQGVELGLPVRAAAEVEPNLGGELSQNPGERHFA